MKLGGGLDLEGEIGRGASKEPLGTVGAQCELRLGARLAGKILLGLIMANRHAIPTAAIPLRESTPGRRTEDAEVHQEGLELRAYVGVDLAAQNYFFKNRSGPRHLVDPGIKILLVAPQKRRGGVARSYHCFTAMQRENKQSAWPERATQKAFSRGSRGFSIPAPRVLARGQVTPPLQSET